ncbi:hypothetical protein BSKO_00151 [Bryopsis sp. KO-2023]|nr:hypothetical protein BSKO_00151 [Bryopsis sp. KO-2023]
MPSKRKGQGSVDRGRKLKRRSKKAEDVYVAFEKKSEEEKNPRKFDWAPAEKDTFIEGLEEDDEIDEEQAFTKEDKEKFGDWFPEHGGDEEDCNEDFEEMDDILDVGDYEEEMDAAENEIGNEDQTRSLIESVAGAGPQQKKKRKADAVVTEIVPESEFNIGFNRNGGGKDLTVGDLMASLGKHRESLGASRWGLERLTESAPVAVPMPRVIRERQERKAGYQNAKEDLTKWKDIVTANRRAPTLEFAAPTLNLGSDKLGSLCDDFEPTNDMEKEVSELLHKAGAVASEDIEKSEDVLAMRSISANQLKAKREQLRKMRSLLFFHEMKAKKVAAIKSKEYHRRLQRSIRKKSVKFSDLPDDEAARKLAEDMEYKRAEERMTQRHSTKTRWAKRIMRRGLNIQDEDTKEAVLEQLRQGQELKKKIERMDAKDGTGSDTDASESLAEEDSEDEGQPQSFKRTRKAALDVLEGKVVDGHTANKGLFALPFMKKAMERRKLESMAQAEEMMAEIDGTEGKQESKSEVTGRLSFSGKKTKMVPQVDSESEDELVLDPEATEAYAAPAAKIKKASDDGDDGKFTALNPAQAKSALAVVGKDGESEEEDEENKFSGMNGTQGSVASRNYLFEGGIDATNTVAMKSSRKTAKKKMDAKVSPADGATIRESMSARENEIKEKKKSGTGQYVMKPPQQQKEASDEELEEISDDEVGQDEPSANGGNVTSKVTPKQSDDFLMKHEGSKSKQSQEDLIEMAFAGDDVGVDFAAEKAKEVEKDLGPELEVNVLPGWGTWKSQQREPKWMAEARAKDKEEREQALAARKDSKMEHVIINEKIPAASAKYMLEDLPRPFKEHGAYEMSMRHPIGKDFNPDDAFQDFTRPSVITRAGVMIDPLRYTDSLKEQAVDTFANYRPTDVKVSRIVGGTVDSFVKFPQAEGARKKREEKKRNSGRNRVKTGEKKK